MAIDFLDIERMAISRDGAAVAATAWAEARMLVNQANRAAFDATVESVGEDNLVGYQFRNKLGRTMLMFINDTPDEVFINVMCPALVDTLGVSERKFTIDAGDIFIAGPWTTPYHATNNEDSIDDADHPEHKDYIQVIAGCVADSGAYDVDTAALKVIPIEIPA